MESPTKSQRPPFTEDFLERFWIKEVLAGGAGGAVYLAQDRPLDRQVAIKVLTTVEADDLARVTREARLLTTLDHPRIVKVFEAGVDGSVQYLVLEYLQTRTIEDVLTRRTLSLKIALGLGERIAETLSYVHGRGLAHKNLKPGNVFVLAGGEVKLSGFGISRQAAREAAIAGSGDARGISDYMAPEQVLGEPGDAASDQYALGAMLFRMVTGEVPFRGADPAAIAMERVIQGPPSPRALRPDLPEPVDALIVRLMARDAAKRFASMDDLRGELIELLEGLGTALDRTHWAPPAEPAKPQPDRLAGPAPAPVLSDVDDSLAGSPRSALLPPESPRAEQPPPAPPPVESPRAEQPPAPAPAESPRVKLPLPAPAPVESPGAGEDTPGDGTSPASGEPGPSGQPARPRRTVKTGRSPLRSTRPVAILPPPSRTSTAVKAVAGLVLVAGIAAGGFFYLGPQVDPNDRPTASASASASASVAPPDPALVAADTLIGAIRKIGPVAVGDQIAADIRAIGPLPFSRTDRPKLDAVRKSWADRFKKLFAEAGLAGALKRFEPQRTRFFSSPEIPATKRLAAYLEIEKLALLQRQCRHSRIAIGLPVSIDPGIAAGFGLLDDSRSLPQMERAAAVALAPGPRGASSKPLADDPRGGTVDVKRSEVSGRMFLGAGLPAGDDAEPVDPARAETPCEVIETPVALDLPILETIEALALSVDVSGIRPESYLVIHLLEKGQSNHPVAIVDSDAKPRPGVARYWHPLDKGIFRSNRIMVKVEFRALPGLPVGPQECRLERVAVHWKLGKRR